MRLQHSTARRNFEEMVDGYAEAALFSSNDESDESGGNPLDENYSRADIADETFKKMKRDCAKFMKQNKRDLDAFVSDPDLEHKSDSHVWSLVGYCFWMNRNGHGVGFWDRGVEEALGERLSKASQKFGEVNLYVHEGEVHQ